MRQVLLILLWMSVGCKAWGSPMPQSTAAHFCQLMVQDADGKLSSIGAFANGDTQLFVEYVFQHDGWRDLRIFPHGNHWYAATDMLPTSLDHEHQRYIQEVFPRIIKEVEMEHWQTVDAYIDRLLEYQRTFSDNTPVRSTGGILHTLLIFLFFLLFLSTGLWRRFNFS